MTKEIKQNLIETYESCPHCGKETFLSLEEGKLCGKCVHCGEPVMACSLCDRSVDCSQCPY